MIKEVQMFTVICDNCGIDVNEGAEYSCWSDKTYAEDSAMESDWIKEGDKHYCFDCFSYDDNDNLILKTIPKTNQCDVCQGAKIIQRPIVKP